MQRENVFLTFLKELMYQSFYVLTVKENECRD